MRKNVINVFIVCCLISTLGSIRLHAQEYTYSGEVTDALGNPLDFVNVVLFALPDTSFVAGTITDSDGKFSFDVKGDLLQFSYLGYQTVYHKTNDLSRRIVIHEGTNQLDEVVVKANLPKYKLTGDGVKSRIHGTSLSLAGTANDVLRQLPMLHEESDGFTVFGKGSPVIYINGRKLRDLSELEQIKSENILQVEIVTDPGTRYEASVKSVIRIRTITPVGEGWGVSLYSDYYQWNKEDLSDQLDLNYRKKKWDVFGTFRYSRNNYFTKSEVNQSVYVDTLWNQNNQMYNKGLNQQILTMAGCNYEINDSNQLGTRLQIRWPFDKEERSNIESLVMADNEYYDRWCNNEYRQVNSDCVYDYNLYYSGQLGKWTADFNFDAMWSGSQTYSEVDEESQEQDDRLVQSVNNVNNRLYATRLFFGHPLWLGNLYFGAEHTCIHRQDDYINKQEFVPTSFSKLNENQLGAFVEYSAHFPFGMFKAGVRYEYEDFDYFEKDEYKPEQSKTYNQFFPSLSFATQLGQLGLQLAYNSKVHRPTFHQLSNNVFYGNRYTLQTGNPLLRPTRSNNIGLMGHWKILQFSLNYRMEHDAIIYSSEQLESNPAVSKVMFKNIDRLPSFIGYVSVSPVVGIWSSDISVGVRKQWLDVVSNDVTFHMNRPVWNFGFNQKFKLPVGFLLSVDASYQTTGDYQNVYLNTSHYILDAALVKSFFNDVITIQLKGYDLLDGYRDGNVLYNKQSQLELFNKVDRRRVGISFKYKFNSMKNKYKGGNLSNADKNRL